MTSEIITITIAPGTTIADIRAQLPQDGRYTLVEDSNGAVLWIEPGADGSATLNDANTSVPVEEDEDLYLISTGWVQATD